MLFLLDGTRCTSTVERNRADTSYQPQYENAAQSQLMRKLYLSLLLPFFMLLVQQGAVWHEMGHLAGSDTTTTATSSNGLQDKAQQDKAQQDKELPADKLCEICLAFAQVSGVAKTEVPLLSLLSFNHALTQWVATSVATAEAPALRNRGPPTLL